MYSGELEIQAKRKALAILHDEITRILNAARDLSALTDSIIAGDNDTIESSISRVRSTEEEVENLRRRITREVSEIGSLMVYREAVLRTAYIIDDIAGYISGIAFRLSNMNVSSLKKGKFDVYLKELTSMVVEAIFKLNEMARALSINPASTIEMAQEVQELERRVDEAYRKLIIQALDEIPNTKDLLLLKDVIEGIEGMADKCQVASDSLTILALSM
jgi:predicted phosphate transport protein (TIGR00153 family)